MTYLWTRTGGTGDSSVAPSDPAALQTSFTAETLNPGDADVTHIFTLRVTDNQGSTQATDTVTFTVTSAFAETVANAAVEGEEPGSGKIIRVPSGDPVTLDGRSSVIDYRRLPPSYSWARTDGTLGASVDLTGAKMETASFTADILEPGDPDVIHVFTLTVTDSMGVSDTDEVTVQVYAVAQVEVDIHVSPPELTVREGDSDTYRVRLSTSPGQEVSVIAFSDNEDVVLERQRLEFNANDWNTWQEVRISTVADSDKEDDTARIQHRLAATETGVILGQPGDVRVTVRDEDPILRPVGEYLEARARALINTQPDLTHFLKQNGTTPGGGGFTFKATDGRLTLDGGFVHNSVWGEVTGSYTNGEFGDTKSVLGSFGIHRKYTKNFLAGAMLQLDLAENELTGQAGTTGMIDGTGWLAGPYFAARHDTQPLYFEGRLLYGQSDNDIRFIGPALGVRTGSFDTRRLLAQVRVEGELALSEGETGPRLIPYADVRWTENRANAFTDNHSRLVPGQKVSTGQLELGSNVEVPIAMRIGAMTLTGGLGLVWSNTEGDYIPSDSRSRGRGEIGFSYDLDDNLRIDFDSFYDGIGSSRYEGYGLSLSAEMKF